MRKKRFEGVCTALCAPCEGDSINYHMLEALLERQISAGVSAIVLSGTTGESPTLTKQEKLELFQRGWEILKDRALLIAGTGSNCTSQAVDLSIEAEDLGADALLVVTPYYNKATPEGLIAHYTTIADRVHIPLLIYNVPSRTGVDVPVSVRQNCPHPKRMRAGFWNMVGQ